MCLITLSILGHYFDRAINFHIFISHFTRCQFCTYALNMSPMELVVVRRYANISLTLKLARKQTYCLDILNKHRDNNAHARPLFSQTHTSAHSDMTAIV